MYSVPSSSLSLFLNIFCTFSPDPLLLLPPHSSLLVLFSSLSPSSPLPQLNSLPLHMQPIFRQQQPLFHLPVAILQQIILQLQLGDEALVGSVLRLERHHLVGPASFHHLGQARDLGVTQVHLGSSEASAGEMKLTLAVGAAHALLTATSRGERANNSEGQNASVQRTGPLTLGCALCEERWR